VPESPTPEPLRTKNSAITIRKLQNFLVEPLRFLIRMLAITRSSRLLCTDGGVVSVGCCCRVIRRGIAISGGCRRGDQAAARADLKRRGAEDRARDRHEDRDPRIGMDVGGFSDPSRRVETPTSSRTPTMAKHRRTPSTVLCRQSFRAGEMLSLEMPPALGFHARGSATIEPRPSREFTAPSNGSSRTARRAAAGYRILKAVRSLHKSKTSFRAKRNRLGTGAEHARGGKFREPARLRHRPTTTEDIAWRAVREDGRPSLRESSGRDRRRIMLLLDQGHRMASRCGGAGDTARSRGQRRGADQIICNGWRPRSDRVVRHEGRQRSRRGSPPRRAHLRAIPVIRHVARGGVSLHRLRRAWRADPPRLHHRTLLLT